jgi:hypothetical protein
MRLVGTGHQHSTNIDLAKKRSTYVTLGTGERETKSLPKYKKKVDKLDKTYSYNSTACF